MLASRVNRRSWPRGFTLLEVLVALAVLAVGLGATVKLALDSSTTAALLRDRAVAGWVAADRLKQVQLADAWPPIGTRRGEQTMAGQRWRWQLDVAATADAGLRRVTVTVRAAGADEALAEQVAFRGDS